MKTKMLMTLATLGTLLGAAPAFAQDRYCPPPQNGNGYGSGYDTGYGYGNGDGYGNGYGYGNGNGYGYGNRDGDRYDYGRVVRQRGRRRGWWMWGDRRDERRGDRWDRDGRRGDRDRDEDRDGDRR